MVKKVYLGALVCILISSTLFGILLFRHGATKENNYMSFYEETSLKALQLETQGLIVNKKITCCNFSGDRYDCVIDLIIDNQRLSANTYVEIVCNDCPVALSPKDGCFSVRVTTTIPVGCKITSVTVNSGEDEFHANVDWAISPSTEDILGFESSISGHMGIFSYSGVRTFKGKLHCSIKKCYNLRNAVLLKVIGNEVQNVPYRLKQQENSYQLSGRINLKLLSGVTTEYILLLSNDNGLQYIHRAIKFSGSTIDDYAHDLETEIYDENGVYQYSLER